MPSPGEVQTFRGPVSSDDLGTTLVHEHVFVGHPELDLNLPHPEWSEDDAIEVAVAGLERLWELGIRTVVDLTVLGRRGVLPSPTGATVVPAGGRVALLVDAITGAEASPAVRVRVYRPVGSTGTRLPAVLAFFGGSFQLGGVEYTSVDAAFRMRTAESNVIRAPHRRQRRCVSIPPCPSLGRGTSSLA